MSHNAMINKVKFAFKKRVVQRAILQRLETFGQAAVKCIYNMKSNQKLKLNDTSNRDRYKTLKLL